MMKTNLKAFLIAACALVTSCSQSPEEAPVRYGAVGEGDADYGDDDFKSRPEPMDVRPESRGPEAAASFGAAKRAAAAKAGSAGTIAPAVIAGDKREKFAGREEFSASPAAYHAVRSKETWYRISKHYGLKPEQLAAANGMKVKHPLSIGMKLRVPAKGQTVYDFTTRSARAEIPAAGEGRFADVEKRISGWKRPEWKNPDRPVSEGAGVKSKEKAQASERNAVKEVKSRAAGGAKGAVYDLTETAKEKTPAPVPALSPERLRRAKAADPAEKAETAASDSGREPADVAGGREVALNGAPVPVLRPVDLLSAGGFAVARRGDEPRYTLEETSSEESVEDTASSEQGSADEGGFSLADRLRGVVRRGTSDDEKDKKKQSAQTEHYAMKTPEPGDEAPSFGPGDVRGDEFVWPVKGKVISPYGAKPGGLYNEGVNISAPEGTPVRSAAGGKVVYSGNELRGYGNLILIKHADGFITTYAHNRENVVKKGDFVRKGQVIARVGSTGNVNGSQLHFGVRKGREAVDPSLFFKKTL